MESAARFFSRRFALTAGPLQAYADHTADFERLASASLTRAELETLIRLLKMIGYETAAAPEQSEEESPA
jgi:hypothetical protein